MNICAFLWGVACALSWFGLRRGAQVRTPGTYEFMPWDAQSIAVCALAAGTCSVLVAALAGRMSGRFRVLVAVLFAVAAPMLVSRIGEPTEFFRVAHPSWVLILLCAGFAAEAVAHGSWAVRLIIAPVLVAVAATTTYAGFAGSMMAGSILSPPMDMVLMNMRVTLEELLVRPHGANAWALGFIIVPPQRWALRTPELNDDRESGKKLVDSDPGPGI